MTIYVNGEKVTNREDLCPADQRLYDQLAAREEGRTLTNTETGKTEKTGETVDLYTLETKVARQWWEQGGSLSS